MTNRSEQTSESAPQRVARVEENAISAPSGDQFGSSATTPASPKIFRSPVPSEFTTMCWQGWGASGRSTDRLNPGGWPSGEGDGLENCCQVIPQIDREPA